jgi:hypothetical protein
MKKKYIEMKLALVEKEIKFHEIRLNSAEVNLRQHKNKQMELIEQLEEIDNGK